VTSKSATPRQRVPKVRGKASQASRADAIAGLRAMRADAVPNIVAFARRQGRPVVVFDLEHTGGTKENRAITELAALVVHPDGGLSTYSTLVKPPDGTVFVPMISAKTGIWPSTVARAPTWHAVIWSFVIPHRQALWCGFNSRACDMPALVAECRRVNVHLPEPAHLDIMQVSGGFGSLSARVKALLPEVSTESAHVAAHDVRMTALLLNALLPHHITDNVLMRQGLTIPR